jgi:sugar/nucleoside kinase (ribokinase family)
VAALACGLATVDVVQTVERVPAADEKVVALATRVEAGGPALNAATTAALLGMPCRLVTAVGGAPLAAVVRADCAAAGVDLSDVAGDRYEVPVATVLLTRGTGERAVVSHGALGPDAGPTPTAGALGALLDGIRAVLVDGHHLGVAVPLAAAARARGIPVLLDAGSWKPGLPDLLGSVDLLLASAAFHPPTGQSLADLLALGPTWVARSAGAAAVHWAAADGSAGSVEVPAVPVVDTLGAGDVLHGALLAELAHHGPGRLRQSLARAVAVATRSVQAPGARGWAAGVSRSSRGGPAPG